MKRILIIIGILFIIVSVLSLVPYISDIGTLSEFEKGGIVGRFIFLVLGVVLVFIGGRR